MTPRTTIPAEITQAADNASSAAKRAAVALNRSATYQSMRLARIDMQRAATELGLAIGALDSMMADSVREIAA